MDRLLASLFVTLLAFGALIAIDPSDKEDPESFGFGMNAGSISAQTHHGVKPDYGTFWVGPWTLTSGWGGPGSRLETMREQSITPAIHYYYWGDDISQECLEDGCWSDLHGAWKNQAGWQQLAEELVEALDSRMKGDPVFIFLETEFNKGGMDQYGPLDGMLAEKARYFKTHYPNANVVLPFGNWDSEAWGTFDEAAAESDTMGLQGMRGSTRHSFDQYLTLWEATLDGVKSMKSTFGKPVFIMDIALSSYPDEDYLDLQALALKKFFTGSDELSRAGAMGLIYRGWYDDPYKNTDNWFGEAERHFGFAWRPNQTLKPAGHVWIDGVQAVRAGGAHPPQDDHDPEEPGSFASFTLSENIDEWWVEVEVVSTATLLEVDAQVDGGSWKPLDRTDRGTWANSIHVPTGSEVVLRATDQEGTQAFSGTYRWLESREAEGGPS